MTWSPTSLFIYNSEGKKKTLARGVCSIFLRCFVIKSVLAVVGLIVVVKVTAHVVAAPFCLASETKHLWNASVAPSPVGQGQRCGGNIPGMASR